MGKVPVDRERFTMVVIIGNIVAETCFRWKVEIGSTSHCLLDMQKFSNFVDRK